jgi:16S rRNA (cytosine967-C5)-methyltransferase
MPPSEGLVGVQRVAADILGRVLGGKNLDRELADVLSKAKTLSANERAAVHSICFDALRHHGLIAAQLDMLLSDPLSDVPVRHLLLVALSQLQFSKVASHTIVDCAVNAVEAAGYARAKGLTNAVLRNYLRDPAKFKRERFKDDVAKYDFPRWWIARLSAEAPERWQAILESASARPPMHLRVNARKTTVPATLAALAEKGIAATHMFDHAIALEAPLSVFELPGFSQGHVSVQDAGAQLAAVLLDAKKGMRVLDACAAPGGKTGHILERADVDLVAVDDDRMRMKRVDENLNRLGLFATTRVADAAQLDLWWDGKKFDRILLDVPCSGSGVTRRHPDIKWIRRETDLKGFAKSQTALLLGLWKCLEVGGRLLYVTCSVFQSENEDIVAQLLRREPSAHRLPLQLPDDAAALFDFGSAKPGTNSGTLFPNAYHDGFYYALIEKR